MPNNKENARINKKSDMVIGMEDYVMMKEWMRYLINWFKDKWIVKNMIECLMNWWVNDTKENLMPWYKWKQAKLFFQIRWEKNHWNLHKWIHLRLVKWLNFKKINEFYLNAIWHLHGINYWWNYNKILKKICDSPLTVHTLV